ncbi:MAG: phosphoadenosine phosphosulfate reductase family protein [Leptolyngbyaceae bacterium]|nr:phosphoadenosine phosphosulfate reductase family protein [Leptolyngbyaceae bacterium]
MTNQTVRHILGLSGGKDSTALAILLHQEIPQMEYFFCDTHRELPETYDYLDKIKTRLNIKIHYLCPNRDFDHWLTMHNGYLPSPKRRWCTEQMKIKPLEKWVGDNSVISYIGIRADENRDGYISKKQNITPVYPFKERGYTKADVIKLLNDWGIGLPKYYEWRSRSGCFFCFFQRKYEWIMLAERHPDLFERAMAYEQNHKDGRTYTWTEGETLAELLERKAEIIANHERAMVREKSKAVEQSLGEVLERVLDEEDDGLPCLACHL